MTQLVFVTKIGNNDEKEINMKFQVSISHQKVVDNKKLDLDKSKYKTKSRCTRYIIIFFRTIDCEHTLSQGMLLSLKDRLQVCNSKIREATAESNQVFIGLHQEDTQDAYKVYCE